MTHIMVDLETFGTSPGSVIASIGAARFDPAGGEITDTFYCAIGIESCLHYGLTMDGSTVKWWLHPDRDEARKALLHNPQDLDVVLEGFASWAMHGHATAPVIWGNGATFDNVLLAMAYDKVGIPRPWGYRGDRCYRTIRALAPAVEFVPLGTHHNALDDAVAQARHMQAICQTLELKL